MATILKLLHVAAAIVFLGNILTGLYWHAHAERTADPRFLADLIAWLERHVR